jgi:NAD(P)-dependent dehydrogenase (short-subunit alcohol dehydrogenase family)
MQITGKKVLILGGWGLVGSALCHKIMEQKPAKLIVTSLKQSEAEEAVRELRAQYPASDPNMFAAEWGNIFTRTEYKDQPWGAVLADSKLRKDVIGDIFDELTQDMLDQQALYNMLKKNTPDIVVDCINTATTIAYQDVYTTTNTVIRSMKEGRKDEEEIERMMASMYIPQLSRHIQVLYNGLLNAKTSMYVKVGTSGTGGMGLNIPYTHSEERPSRVLMAKSAVAGAMTLLLFLMARTPNGCMIKEVKPTAAIAWKKIAYGPVRRKGQPIPLVDMDAASARPVNGSFKFSDHNGVKDTNGVFESVYIDTGENGIFSKAEFEAISSIGQMEIITPEEISLAIVNEIMGGNSGKDVIQGLDAFTYGPTYRGGVLRNSAMKKLEQLEKEHGDSIAFELLGPPRLSKLLFEAYLMRKLYGSVNNVLKADPKEISDKAFALLKEDSKLRSQMLSIGLVILLPDGKQYLRGKEVKIPVQAGADEIKADDAQIEKWCYEAWVDLRANNFKQWQERFENIKKQVGTNEAGDTSSRYCYSDDYWSGFDAIDEGKIVGWVFENEDHGWRFKR